jgi:hypothetical protein
MPFMPDVISQSHPPEKMSGTKTVPDLLGYRSTAMDGGSADIAGATNRPE